MNAAAAVASGGSGDDDNLAVIGGFGAKPKPQAVSSSPTSCEWVQGSAGDVTATKAAVAAKLGRK